MPHRTPDQDKQKGCWPDGSSGQRTLPVCPECGWEPGYHLATCSRKATVVDVPVLPVELVEGLANATAALTEEIGQFTAESERLGRAVNVSWGPLFTARDAAESALASYRQAMGEGQ